MRKIFTPLTILTVILLTSCHHHCGHHGHNHESQSNLTPWLTFFTALFVAFIAGLFTLRQVKLNNITKSKLDRMDRLRAYFASFLLKYNEPSTESRKEVKQNLAAILVTLDSDSTEHRELHRMVKEYWEYIKVNDYDDSKVEQIMNEANRVFRAEWQKIDK